MANKIYQDLLKVDIASLIAESEAISSIQHNGVKGSVREFGLGRLLMKYLPFGWDIGTGQIHDSNGKQSNETDIIIYNKALIPPMMFSNTLGLFPIESCMYAIEVKSCSTSQEIQSTINKYKTLYSLQPLSKFNPTIRVYFAYSSDLSAESELERYKKYDPLFYKSPAFNIICVIGKGYWYYLTEKKGDDVFGYWRYMPSLEGAFELACFLGGIINTLNQDPSSKFGMYLMGPEHQFQELEKVKIN